MADQTFEVGLGASEIFRTSIYSFFGAGHLVQIALSAVILALLYLLCFKKKHWIDRVLLICFVFGVANMTALIVYSCATGIYNLELYLPLHICNLFMIVMPLALFCKGKVRKFLMDYIVGCGLGGCWLNIILPITSLLYFPPFHFVSIMVWTYHIMIGFLGGYMIVSGNYKRFNAINILSMLTGLIILSYIANGFLKTNFLFINPERAVFPLNYFYMAFGDLGTLAVAMMIYGAAVMLHLGFYFYDLVKSRSVSQLIKDWGVADFFAHHEFDKKFKESELYAHILNTEIAKELKKDTNVVNKLCKAIMESGIVGSLVSSKIEDVTDPREVENMLAKSGVVKRISATVALADIKKALIPRLTRKQRRKALKEAKAAN